VSAFFEICLSLCLLCLAACGSEEPVKGTESATPEKSSARQQSDPASQPGDTSAATELTPPTLDDVGNPDEVAVIESSNGQIVLEFFPDLAPLHVANFKKLARFGFYDGTTFHRVVPGFVIQGGDPNSKDSDPTNDGTGGPPWQVKAEFNDRPHLKGTLSMARSREYDSAGSQFFICLDRVPHLDKQYTVFGQVIKGLDVVEEIGRMKRDPTNPRDRKLPAVVMRRVRIVKRGELGL